MKYCAQVSEHLELEHCQELDGSWLLGVSTTVMLWRQGISGAGCRGSEESAKLKLDRG